jgi:DNA-binding CsgD family transcriptional regulator
MRRGRPPYPDLLTPREQEVLDLLRRGLTNQEIADRLGISLPGARYHVSEILSKLGVDSRQEAAAWSMEASGSRRWSFAFLAAPVQKLTAGGIGKGIAAGTIGVAAVALALLALGVIAMGGPTNGPDYGDCSSGEESSNCPAGKLAYVQDGDIWSKQLRDGTPQRLTTDKRSFAPAWSPSGDWLLFRKRAEGGETEHWLARADGSNSRRLEASETGYAWSPVSDTYASVQGGGLIVQDADGSNLRDLLPRPDAGILREVRFVWSPDGAWLAYSRRERPASGPADSWDYVAIWRVRPDGSDSAQVVTARAGTDVDARGAPAVGFTPIGFLPDARGVLYTAEPLQSDARAESMELRRVAIDGGQAFRTQFRAFPNYRDFLDYAEDGSLAVLIAGTANFSPSGSTWHDMQLVYIRPLGRDWGGLPGEGKADVSPAISPDASSIVFASSPAFGSDLDPPEVNQRRIWIIKRSGPIGGREQLSDDPDYRDERPQWSRDGRHILFARLSATDSRAPASLWSLELDRGSISKVQDGLSLPPHGDMVKGHVPWEQVFDWWQP